MVTVLQTHEITPCQPSIVAIAHRRTEQDVPRNAFVRRDFENSKRIRAARVREAIAVNRELVLLYWQIGREILQRQQREGWGTKVIDRLAADLRRVFPDMAGLSPRNLKYMRAFGEAGPDEEIVQQLVAQIPWGHNVRLLDYLKDRREREWYIPGHRQLGEQTSMD